MCGGARSKEGGGQLGRAVVLAFSLETGTKGVGGGRSTEKQELLLFRTGSLCRRIRGKRGRFGDVQKGDFVYEGSTRQKKKGSSALGGGPLPGVWKARTKVNERGQKNPRAGTTKERKNGSTLRFSKWKGGGVEQKLTRDAKTLWEKALHED